MISNGKNTTQEQHGMLRTSDVSIAVFSDSANVAMAMPIPIKAAE